MSMSEVARTDVRAPLHSRPKPLQSSAVDFGYPPCGRSSPGDTRHLLANQSLSRTLSDLGRGERSKYSADSVDTDEGPARRAQQDTTQVNKDGGG
jgi:hypothetical protein